MEVALGYGAGLLTLINPFVLPVLPIVLASGMKAGRHGPLGMAAGLSLSFVVVGMFDATFGYTSRLDPERMAELGWVGLTFPEEHGGVGLRWVDLLVVLEETGRSLFPSPLVSTVLAGTALTQAGSAAQREQWLPKLASGAAIGPLAFQAGAAGDLSGGGWP